MDEWKQKYDTHTQTYTHTYNGILFHLKKEGNPVICDNTVRSGRHYAKKNKPDTEGQILYFFQTHRSRVEWWLQGAWGKETRSKAQKVQSLSYQGWIHSGDILCSKKGSGSQRRNEKIYPTECRVTENNKGR